MIYKVAFDRFYIVVSLSVDVDLDARKVKVFKVERISLVGSVERLIFHHRDHYSARNLTRKESFVHIVTHAGADAIAFTHDASDGIIDISNFERFRLRDKHARTNVHLSKQQFTLEYLYSKRSACCIRH